MRAEFLPDVSRPSVTVDMVVLTILDGALSVLVVERGGAPFQGQLALPGGFVHVGEGGRGGESLDDAAARELVEETGLSRAQVLLTQIGAFGAPGRDPRGRVITVAYTALVRPEVAAFVRAGSDAAAARWVSVTQARSLAFDHDAIVRATLERVRHDVERTSTALHLAPETFSIAELRAVFEALLGRTLDAGNFRRRFLRLLEDGVIEKAPGTRVTARKRAQVFRAAR
jgi:8-oxo-dGTP diphosphatase